MLNSISPHPAVFSGHFAAGSGNFILLPLHIRKSRLPCADRLKVNDEEIKRLPFRFRRDYFADAESVHRLFYFNIKNAVAQTFY
jgi:hypothetical protein